MAVTLKCPDCGHAKQSESDTPQTCPKCEGTMKKQGYKAKAAPVAAEKPKPKPKPRDDDEDDEPAPRKVAAKPAPAPAKADNPFSFGDDGGDEDDEPKPKTKPAARSRDDVDDEDDAPKPRKAVAKPTAKPAPARSRRDEDEDEDDEADEDFTQDGKAAKRIGIDTGFANKKLMKQVAKEMSRGEVLHWAARPSMELAEKKAKWMRIGGGALAVVGLGVAGILLGVAQSVPWYVGVIIGVVFVLFGLVFALVGPKSVIRQAERGWYAVTDRRAIVYMANLWGDSGHVDSYEPSALRKMWVQKSSMVKGAGDLIFKTEVHDNRTKWVDKRTGRTVKTTGSRSEHHYGFIGIDDVKDVETLVHDVLLHAGDDDEEDDD